MAQSRRYVLGNQLDFGQLFAEAQTRWLRPAEICEILRNHQNFPISPEPPTKPPSGSLFLYDRKVLRYFRKDGHNWRKKKDGKTVKEAHERLKVGSIDALHCYYAHGEDNENFQRRSYWLLEEDYMHIVLVHYREVQGNKTHSSRNRETEDTGHSSQTASPVSSSYISNQNQLHSQITDSTSQGSAQTPECEEVESANNYQANSIYPSFPELHQYGDMRVAGDLDHELFRSYFPCIPTNQYSYEGKKASIPGSNLIFQAGHPGGDNIDVPGFGLSYETQKPLDMASWGELIENYKLEPYGAPLLPLVSSTQPASVPYIPRQENVMLGQHFTDEFNIKMESVNQTQGQEHGLDQKMQTPTAYDQNVQFSGNEICYVDFHHSSDMYSGQQIDNLVQNGHQIQRPDADIANPLKSGLEDNLTRMGNHSSDPNHSLVDNDKTKGLKKLDSFTRWMNNELGEVDEPHLQSSLINWDTIEDENVSDDSGFSPQVHLDAYLLSTVLSQEQLFSIIDFSPSWAYANSDTKVLITGTFLKNQEYVAKCEWACMFGEVEVPVEVVSDGVLCCIAPTHKTGRVPFYITCSNRLACSEVREFEFRVKYSQDVNMEDLDSVATNEILLRIRLGKLLSLGSVGQPAFTSGEFCSGKVKGHVLQRILKDKLHAWLLQKVTEDGKGPNVLDKEGQGVIHLAAALGYDWAIMPTINAGVSVNFRDVNGWTALHWAAFCGRERTVVALLQLGAAPGALTDPSPKYPAGRTPADLASSNGHKGIAGFLAETSITTHLSTLNVKDGKDGEIPETSGTVIQTVSQRIITPDIDGNVLDMSLKDSLAAVCNATQAAARIHEVFRVNSFQKKKLIEYADDTFGMSDERALSLISVKSNRAGRHDEPVHSAAIKIQNKFRGWKGRRDFLLIRQRVIKIQAHVRGHQVRKHYKKIIWSVGIVEKAILRWRRKGSGLRGFRLDTHIESSTIESGPSKREDYDFLKEGRKQTEERMQKALARVKSMVQYPEARDQYRRLLTAVSEFQESKAVSDGNLNSLEEVGDDYDDLINLEELLDDDSFMSTIS